MIPASIRNNNPGAMYPGKSARKFGSTSFETLKSKDGVHKIATFPSHVHGAAAQFDLLNTSYTGMTIEKAVTRWCGGYYAPIYCKVLKDRAKLEPDTLLTRAMLADHEVAIPLAKAMAWQEAGQDYPLDDAGWREAHQMALGGETTAPGWNPRNDVPTPKPETRREPWWRQIKRAVLAIGSVGYIEALNGFEGTLLPPPPAGLKQTIVNLGGWGDAVPFAQWRVFLVGAGVFAAVAVVSAVVRR